MPLTPSLALVLAVAAGAVCDRIVVHRTVRRLRRELSVAAHNAAHDRLTGLLNRGGIEDAYTAGTDTVRWLLVVDLDAFKAVNDRHGHPAGDLILAALGARIRRLTVAAGSGGRLGGDEFAVLLPHSGGLDITRVAGALAAPITAAGCGTGAVTVSASIGVTAVPAGLSWKQALTRADIALYRAKQGHRPVVFDPAMTYPRPPWPRRQTRDHDHRSPAYPRGVPPRRRVLPRRRPDTSGVRPTGTGGQPS